MPPIAVDTDAWKDYVGVRKGGAGQFISEDGGYFQLEYNKRKLKYLIEAFGTQPSTGYPLYIGLHGGGERPVKENDASWRGLFKEWYRESIATLSGASGAIYVAARGVSNLHENDSTAFDEYNLHSQNESYVLLQSMIANLLLPEPNENQHINGLKLNNEARQLVDSDRVYLMGFSAGGDGVYQLSARIADRFAAVVAGGGHYNSVSLVNLANLPICLQCGERDVVTGGNGQESLRAKATIEAADRLRLPEGRIVSEYYRTNSYDAVPPEWYHYECHIIKDGDHNAWAMTDQINRPQKVLTNLTAWYSEAVKAVNPVKGGGAYTKDVTLKNINSVAWVSQFSRNSIPGKLVWDLSCRAPICPEQNRPENVRPEKFFHWLYIRNPDAKDFDKNDVIFADYSNAKDSTYQGSPWSWITISKPSEYIGILLNETMIPYDRAISIYIPDSNGKYQALTTYNANEIKPSKAIMDQTLLARGDPKLMFSAMIAFEPAQGGGWNAALYNGDNSLPNL